MFELLRAGVLALKSYGANDRDFYIMIYYCSGLIPLSFYCLRINNPKDSIITRIGLQSLRMGLFFVFFYVHYRYGFTNSFIRCNSILLIIYTFVGYHYYVRKEFLYSYKKGFINILKYIFYVAASIEFLYLGYRIFVEWK